MEDRMKSLSFPTKIYIYMTYMAGFVIFVSQMHTMDLQNLGMLIALCVLASLTLIFKVEGATNRSHYTFSFLLYGFTFTLYGPAETILVIVVSNIVEWIWNKPPWFIQLFNTSGYVVVIYASGFVWYWINPSNAMNNWQTALGIILSMAAFNILNHLMVGIVIWLARGEDFKQSGIFDFFPLTLDLALLYFGASLTIVWNYNPFALVLFLIPLYLIYSTLRVPALERKSETDTKTGLFNLEYFNKQFTHELTRANRFDRPLSIILADLDLLRNINNTYGHLAGDEVLISVAKILKQSVRDYDVVCRFGGEEFAILMPETSLSHAFERAEMIRNAVEGAEFIVPTSITPIRATMSFGIAHRENFSQIKDNIMHNADLALYHSKLTGRNRTYGYSNDTYLEYIAVVANEKNHLEPAFETTTVKSIPIEKSPEPISDERHIETDTKKSDRETSSGTAIAPSSKKTIKSKLAVKIFIGVLTVVSLIGFAVVARLFPTFLGISQFDWVGIIVITGLIITSEIYSIDLYIKEASVSTSAIPIMVSFLLFGPLAVFWSSLIVALTLFFKYRSHISRFFFNFSNHILAGSLLLVLISVWGKDLISLPTLDQIIISVISAMIMFLITTWTIAFGMSLDLKQSASQIWVEQFSWLAPYYVGIGLIVFTMVFGYKHDQTIGLLLMVIPMVLLRISQKQYIDRTRDVVTELSKKNQVMKKKSDEITELNEGLLITLSEVIDLRDPYVLGHSKQVSLYATKIAKAMGLNDNQVELIRKAGLLHDIGKLGIPMEILTKPGKLSQEEYEIVKEHAALGSDLVKNNPSLHQIASIIRHHHEHFNGHGYPDKIAGARIPIEARILSVADAIEVMITDRPYRKAISLKATTEELIKHSGTQFDPIVIETAIKVLNTKTVIGEQRASTQTDTQVRISKKFATQSRLS